MSCTRCMRHVDVAGMRKPGRARGLVFPHRDGSMHGSDLGLIMNVMRLRCGVIMTKLLLASAHVYVKVSAHLHRSYHQSIPSTGRVKCRLRHIFEERQVVPAVVLEVCVVAFFVSLVLLIA